MIKYYKKLNKEKVAQIWLEESNKEGLKLFPYNCEQQYYGEGIKMENLIEIDIKEFQTLGWLFNCFTKEEEGVFELRAVFS